MVKQYKQNNERHHGT